MEAKRFNVERLSEDLLIEVLVRLPVKHLIGCKLVSKTWFALISSPNFIKSHLHRSITVKGDDETLIAHLYDDEEDEEDEQFYSYGPFGLIKLGSGEIAADLKYPYSQGEGFVRRPYDAVLVASDCGIVCVRTRRHGEHYLWNPATKQSKLIPSHTNHNDGLRRCSLGFGVEQMGLDCVIVSVGYDVTETPFSIIGNSASFYSANRNSWQEIEVEPTDVPVLGEEFDVCLHGFILCIGYKGMMAFDLQKEVFICGVELPVIGDRNFTITNFHFLQAAVTDFNDSIAVTIFNYEKLDDKYFNLWTLDDEACLRGDHRVKASWTKMLSIYVGLPIESVLGYYNHRDIMLVDRCGEWLLFKSDQNRRIIAPFYMDRYQVFKYAESLVPIPGSKQVRWN